MAISDSHGVSQWFSVEKCCWIIKGNTTCFALADRKTTRSSVVRHDAEKGPILMKMVVDCPLAIKSIDESLFQTIRDQAEGKIGPASLLLSWHWDLFPISIEAFVLPQFLLFYVAFSSPLCFLQHWVGHLDQINFVLDVALVFRNHTLAASAQLFPARLPLNWKYSLVNSGRQGGREGVPQVPEVDLFSTCEVGQKVIKSPLERFHIHFQSM